MWSDFHIISIISDSKKEFWDLKNQKDFIGEISRFCGVLCDKPINLEVSYAIFSKTKIPEPINIWLLDTIKIDNK